MISSERLNGVQAFVMAAETGSFTQAAQRLGLTRSAVGKGVARLEERLGVRLFQRTTRKLSLTEEGRAFHEGCVRALSELEAAEAEVANDARAAVGRVRLAAPSLFGARWITPVLHGLTETHPQLEIEAVFANRRTDLIEEGFDLAVRIGVVEDSATLAARALGTQETVLSAAPAYLERRGRPISIADLATHDGLSGPTPGRTAAWKLREPGGAGRSIRLNGRLRLSGMDAIAHAVRAGAGVAQLPLWMVAADLATGRLETVLPGSCGAGAPITALWPRTRNLPVRVRVVLDALVQTFLPRAPWEA